MRELISGGAPIYGTLVQQVMRTDLLFYALNVAARPDSNWRLVSFPYWTQYARNGEATRSKHTDINIPELLRSGLGANTVETPIAIDDKTENGCTIVVPGFYRYVREWWGKAQLRGNLKREGPIHEMGDIYSKEDEDIYGKFVLAVCRRGDVRPTLPRIVNGSIGKNLRRRRVVHPCLVGVNSDHHIVDLGEIVSWEEVSRAHRDISPMQVGPVGERHRFVVGEGFAAAIEMRGVSTLGDALLGARRWDSRAVLMGRDLVLGTDEGEAWRYIEGVRTHMRQVWKESFKLMVNAEAREYGAKAYLNSMEALCTLALGGT